MRRCIVHFGMPKTGSTSIQASLLAAGPLPEAHFLQVGDGNTGRVLATLFMADPSQFHLNRKWDVPKKTLEHEAAQARQAFEQQFRQADRSFILSGEAISSMSADTLMRMVTWLRTQVDQVEAVGYIRRPRGYMDSEFQQKIKAGRGRFDPARNYPGYRERFEPIEAAFGPSNVRYWLFDPAHFPGHDVVRDFAARLGLSIPESAYRRANESLTRGGTSLLYIYRKLGEPYGAGKGMVEENRRLTRRLREAPGPKLRLARSLVEPVLQAQQDDIDWMSQRLGCGLMDAWGEDPPGAIASEEDLLSPGEAALDWLADQLDRPRASARALPLTEVAQWVHELRQQLAQREGGGTKGRDRSRLLEAPTLELTPAELQARVIGRLLGDSGSTGEVSAELAARVASQVTTQLHTWRQAWATADPGAQKLSLPDGLGQVKRRKRAAPGDEARAWTWQGPPDSAAGTPPVEGP